MKRFNNLEEMQPYYNEKTDAYEFIENGKRIDIEITFNLSIDSVITAGNIKAWDITARRVYACDIDAWNIKAGNITAQNIHACDMKVWDIRAQNLDAGDIKAESINAEAISFHAVCFASNDIICNSIKGSRENSRYFSLDGNVTIKEDLKMEELKKEIELIGGNLLDTSDGVFVRAYNKAEVKQIQELFKKYPKYKLGYFAEGELYEWLYYEAFITE